MNQPPGLPTAFGTDAARLMAMLALFTAPPSPTVSPLSTTLTGHLVPRQESPTARPKFRDDDDLELGVTAGTSSPQLAEPATATNVSRPTTAVEEVIGDIRSWTFLRENWDGEGASAPIDSSLREASSFVCLLNPEDPVPEPMLLASGRAGLIWDNENLHADLEFTGDGRVTYYIDQRGRGKHKGVVAFDSEHLPAVLKTLLLA